MQLQIETKSSEETQDLAAKIGQKLRGGEVLELVSDVGGGKTTFVRGLAKGAGSADHVSSPTFMISKVYDTKELSIVHFDFYRLQEAGLIAQELEETIADPKNVIVVEWSDIVKQVLPIEKATITITKLGGESRAFEFIYPDSYEYLWEGVR